jgi:hypothetical protein
MPSHGSWVTVGGGLLIKQVLYVLIILAAIVGLAYYYWLYRPQHRPPIGSAYVLSPSLDVLNTTAAVHTVMDVLKSGDRVAILRRGGRWDQIRSPGGTVGWVLGSQLIEPSVYETGQRLLERAASEPVQAVGHTAGQTNLHIKPSVEAPLLAVLPTNARVEFLERRLVRRTAAAGSPSAGSAPTPLDAWYLVRSKNHVGWVLGRLIILDIPPELSQYAASYNLVAWFVLTTVQDNGRSVPEYLVADRVGTESVDFNHVRVFTWWVKRHHYVTAFVEGGLDGAFPIRVEHINHVPYFRLRLRDKTGRKFQKIYGLFNTIVRPVGTVEGWSSDAMPSQPRRQ